MTQAEMKQRLEELEAREFYIYMIDFWSAEDKKILAEIKQEIREIRELLK